MKFDSLKEALRWYEKARMTIGEPRIGHMACIGGLANHRPSVSAISHRLMQENPLIQQIPIYPSGRHSEKYTSEAKLIAVLDIGKILSRFPKWKHIAARIYANDGKREAIRAIKRLRRYASGHEAEKRLWEAVSQVEEALREEGYLGNPEESVSEYSIRESETIYGHTGHADCTGVAA